MTNEAMSAILEHLCNEARNSVHAAFGAMELVRDVVADPAVRASIAIGRASADQLLRSIDDALDLLSTVAYTPAAIEPFDLLVSLNEIVDVLNVASGRRAKRVVLDGPFEAVAMSQDRRAVERVLTRILDAAFKLAQTNVVRVTLGPAQRETRAHITIAARDEVLAVRMLRWLNAGLDQAAFDNPDDVPFEIAMMVAGKHLRMLDGSAALERDPAGHATIVLTLPLQAPGVTLQVSVGSGDAERDALSILVAEDCDDSFALSELVLGREEVWRARDGREALRLLQKQRFDLVFMDVHMPGMDGYAAIRGMREWETQTGNARTPIVVLSSDDVETQRRSAALCGCSGFLRKPLQRGDLANLLERVRQSRTLVA